MPAAVVFVVIACNIEPNNPGTPRSVVVVPALDSLLPGEPAQFNAVAVDEFGRSDLRTMIQWSVSSSAIASVNDNGRVTAKSLGTTRLVATAGSAQGTSLLVVFAQCRFIRIRQSNLELEPDIATVVLRAAQKDSVQLTAVAYDAASVVIYDKPIRWISDDASVANVTPFGLVHSVAVGTTNLRAQCPLERGSAPEEKVRLVVVPQ